MINHFRYFYVIFSIMCFHCWGIIAAEKLCNNQPLLEVNLGKSIPFLELIAKMGDPFVDDCLNQKIDSKINSIPSLLLMIAKIEEEREFKSANKDYCGAASLSMLLAKISPQTFISSGGVESIEALVELARSNQKEKPVTKKSIGTLLSGKLKFLRDWLIQSPDNKSDCMGLSLSVPGCDDGPSAARALAAYQKYFPKTETKQFVSVETYRIQTLRDWARQIPKDTSTCLRPNIIALESECDEGQSAVKELNEFKKYFPKSASQAEFLNLQTKILDYKTAHETTKLNLFTTQYEIAVHPAPGSQEKFSKIKGDLERTDGMVHANCVGPRMDSSGQILVPGKCDLVHKTSLAVRAINQARGMLEWTTERDSTLVRATAIKYLKELDLTIKEHPEWFKYVESSYQSEKSRAEIIHKLGLSEALE